MTNEFGNLTISRVICHEIFTRKLDRQLIPPSYSDELTNLESGPLEIFQSRLNEALTSPSHCVKMEIVNDEDGGTFSICSRSLNVPEARFITNSKIIALKLAEKQIHQTHPGGVVIFFTGTIGDKEKRFVGIIKAETHNGFERKKRGQKLSLQYIDNLVMTPQQKLNKIAIFIENEHRSGSDPRTGDEFDAYIYDHNMTKSESKTAAAYFYDAFLGCTFAQTNKRMTKDFYIHTKEFINKSIDEEEIQLDMINALTTYLKVSQKTTVSVADFADNYLPTPSLKDDYRAHMIQNKVSTGAIQKDTSLIKSLLKRKRFSFTSKVKIYVPTNSDESGDQKLVEIREKVTEDSQIKTIVVIMGEIERFE